MVTDTAHTFVAPAMLAGGHASCACMTYVSKISSYGITKETGELHPSLLQMQGLHKRLLQSVFGPAPKKLEPLATARYTSSLTLQRFEAWMGGRQM